MSLFSFKLDGEVDWYSINPLEMTNFERTATIVALVYLVATIVYDIVKKKRLSGLDKKKALIYTPSPLEDYPAQKKSES